MFFIEIIQVHLCLRLVIFLLSKLFQHLDVRTLEPFYIPVVVPDHPPAVDVV